MLFNCHHHQRSRNIATLSRISHFPNQHQQNTSRKQTQMDPPPRPQSSLLASPPELTPLEAEVLEEYERLAGNMKKVRISFSSFSRLFTFFCFLSIFLVLSITLSSTSPFHTPPSPRG